MTFITFELAPIDQGVKPGLHTGKIINIKIITFNNSEEQLSVEWEIGESTFFDKFKLWDEEVKKKSHAQRKLVELCKAARVVIPDHKAGETLRFDVSVLVGKQVKVLVDEYINDKNMAYAFIRNYAPLSLADTLLNDEIPF